MKPKLKTLSIPYPDFQLYEVIDPDQFDENNRDIVDKINEMLVSLNRTFSESGDGVGADSIPTAPISGLSGTSVQKQLQGLKQIHDVLQTLVNQNHTSVTSTHTAHRSNAELDHPDASVTTRKLRNQSVTSEKIADNTIGARHIVNGQVTDDLLGTRTVTGRPQNPHATTGTLTEMLNVIARKAMSAESRAEIAVLSRGWQMRPLTFKDLKDKGVRCGWLRGGDVRFSAFRFWRF